MKLSLVLLVVFISNVQLRRHLDDLFELENLLNNKYERHSSQAHTDALLDLFDNDDQVDYSEERRTTSSVVTEKIANLGSSSSCVNQYEIKPESLVKVKYLTDDAHLIRFITIEQPSISSELSLKEICMLKCCAERGCDLAMLSEQQTRVKY